jgi:hypothetical protein
MFALAHAGKEISVPPVRGVATDKLRQLVAAVQLLQAQLADAISASPAAAASNDGSGGVRGTDTSPLGTATLLLEVAADARWALAAAMRGGNGGCDGRYAVSVFSCSCTAMGGCYAQHPPNCLPLAASHVLHRLLGSRWPLALRCAT